MVAAVLLIAGGITAIVLLNNDAAPTTTATANSAPGEPSSPGEATTEPSEDSSDPSESDDGGGGSGELPDPSSPEGLGDDPELDALAQDCFAGDLEACDNLYFQADIDSAYETYGDTCGGRQPDTEEAYGICVFDFP